MKAKYLKFQFEMISLLLVTVVEFNKHRAMDSAELMKFSLGVYD